MPSLEVRESAAIAPSYESSRPVSYVAALSSAMPTIFVDDEDAAVQKAFAFYMQEHFINKWILSLSPLAYFVCTIPNRLHIHSFR